MSAPTPPRRALQTRQRALGLDYGHVRIGLATADLELRIAAPMGQYVRRGPAADATFFRQLIAEERPAVVVVGLPVHLSGDESAKSAEARRFGAWLTELTGVSVEYYDERYTSAEAEELLLGAELTSKQRKARRDQLAAQLILQGWLTRGNEAAPSNYYE